VSPFLNSRSCSGHTRRSQASGADSQVPSSAFTVGSSKCFRCSFRKDFDGSRKSRRAPCRWASVCPRSSDRVNAGFVVGDTRLNNELIRFPPMLSTGNPDSLSPTRPPARSRISQPYSRVFCSARSRSNAHLLHEGLFIALRPRRSIAQLRFVLFNPQAQAASRARWTGTPL
jgi:hypothetical protein